MSEPELIKACKLWDKITTKMFQKEFADVMPEELAHNGDNPYSSGDYRPLQCRIDGQKAELTVGSAAGHRVHVDLKEKTLDYYDDDDQPNEVVKQLLEESAGLKCQKNEDGVKCKGVTKENVQKAFRVLAMPTSMDYRLSNCQTETRGDPSEECGEQCSDELESNYNVPSGCDCEEWQSDCVQECVDNYEYPESENCIELEKKFFKDGPEKVELDKWEAIINPKSQKKITEFEGRRRK